ncbi:glycosyltransferase [Candidatus Saccharibacteria bacterium]|nr:glycosyltransferase [Candidatus Saccharibacteria bacterium]
MKKILLVGGGSGGHLTPLFAIRDAILAEAPQTKTEIWTDRKMAPAARARLANAGPVPVRTIISGKYRRYVGRKTPLRERFQNFLDIFRIAFGTLQSFFRLLFSRPDIIFLKGGFTSVPVGFAARFLRIPYIIHESDSDLGLANRLLAGHARIVALGLPPSDSLPPSLKAKAIYTGIPIDAVWFQAPRIHKTGTPNPAKPGRPSVVVLGGGLGAHSLNLEAVKMAKYFQDKVAITAIIGDKESLKLEQELQQFGVATHRFVSSAAELAQIVRSADLVVARAGATTIAELAAASRAVVLIAKATLPGGHQEKNAALLARANAVIDYDGSTLADDQLPLTVANLLADPAQRQSLGAKLHQLGRYDAANTLAKLLLDPTTGKLP